MAEMRKGVMAERKKAALVLLTLVACVVLTLYGALRMSADFLHACAATRCT